MPATDPTELFDVCDAQDRVIGQAPRGEVHARGLLHRAVHIFVLNSQGELLLHRRSTQKDEYPLRITSSASGHLAVSEDYATAAVRELEEELGLVAPLEFAAKFAACTETANEHTQLFVTRTDAAPVPDPDEIAEIEWASPAVVAERIAADPDDFTPPFRVLFDWWHGHIAAPNAVVIAEAGVLDAGDLSQLIIDSEQEGWTFVRRLALELISGENRFDKPREALFVARRGGAVVGTCGLNIDPYIDDVSVGRVRRLYVARTARRLGVGRRLVDSVVQAASGEFRLVRVRTKNPAAARLYERCGFLTVRNPACTHVLALP